MEAAGQKHSPGTDADQRAVSPRCRLYTRGLHLIDYCPSVVQAGLSPHRTSRDAVNYCEIRDLVEGNSVLPHPLDQDFRIFRPSVAPGERKDGQFKSGQMYAVMGHVLRPSGAP